jgi:hypothetical protein
VEVNAFEVLGVRPYLFNNCTTVGTVDAAGSIFIERRFENAVRKRLGKHAKNVLRPRCLSEIKRHFRDFIAPNFQDDIDLLDVFVPGTSNIPEAGVEDGFMSMTS